MNAKLFFTCLIGLAAAATAFAQQPNTEFKIDKITTDLLASPEYNFGNGPKNKKGKNREWLEVEVEFSWQPRSAATDKFVDELVFNYYILLNDKPPQQTNSLLVGSVTHVNIQQGKSLHSVAYLSPRTLERFFDGKPPASTTSMVKDVGVSISKQGIIVAQKSLFASDANAGWWNVIQGAKTGYVLNKNDTPFAPLVWDYYEAIKTKSPGQ